MSFDVQEFAKRYTAAWCSGHPAAVAWCYSPEGSLTINNGTPSIGRPAITAAAQEFMTAFPDLKVMMDSVTVEGGRAIYRWRLDGHNTGPGGTGARVRINGYESWRFGEDGLIIESLGGFDAEDWQRQIQGGSSRVP